MNNFPDSLIASIREVEILRSQLTVTVADYKDAVMRLVAVAQADTSNALPAAQVLLGLYNGYEYHVDLNDLGILDYVNLKAALIAIRGRIFCSIEPHETIDNGESVFKDLSEQWSHLHVSKRYVNK